MTVREKLRWIGICLALGLAGVTGYDTYKYLFWPRAQATVTSIEPVCVYKEAGRSTRRKYIVGCDEPDEADKLIADGYRLQRAMEAIVQAVYEAEPGRKTYATLRPWWDDIATVRPGSVIWIRYSPSTPSEAELSKGPKKELVVVLGILVAGLAAGHLLPRKGKP